MKNTKGKKQVRARRATGDSTDSPTASEVVAARKAEEQAQRERTQRIRERLQEFWKR